MIRLVVIDDDEQIRTILRRYAQADGRFQVVGEAGDAEAGVRIVRERRPDVAVLDVRMAGMDGIAAIPHVLSVAPHVRIVMYTSDLARREEAFAAGAQACHVKGEPVATLLATAARLAGAEAAPEGHTTRCSPSTKHAPRGTLGR